jgi:hypothetical protein
VKRRDFLAVGAAAGAAAVASCGTVLPRGGASDGWPSLTQAELADYLARVDRGMEAIARGTILPRPATDSAVTPKETVSDEALAKQGLRALVAASAYLDLDERSRQHPEVQRRLERWLPELDEAVVGMTAKIAELNPERAAAVQCALRENPELGLILSEKLDEPARLLDVPLKRRLQMRSIITHYAWRMRVQSPSLVADEYLTKMHKIAALTGKSEELKRQLATRLTGEALWRYESLERDHLNLRTAQAGGPAASSPASGPAASAPAPRAPQTPDEPRQALRHAAPPPPPLQPEPEPKPRPGGGLLTAGGVVLGIGAVVFGIGTGVLFGAGSLAGAFLMTPGGIAILVGLILLLVGVAKRYG